MIGHRFPVAGTALAGVLLALGSCAAAGDVTTPAGGGSSAVSAAPSTAGPAAPTVVPRGALLQPEDLRGVSPEPAAADLAAHLRPPHPCGPPAAGEPLRESTAAVRVVYPLGPDADGSQGPTVLLELVMKFRADGDVGYLTGLRDEVARCPGTSTGRQWTRVADGVVGESTLLRVSEAERLPDGRTTSRTVPVLVARAGPGTVVVLADLGWESSGGRESLVRELGVRAVERARTPG